MRAELRTITPQWAEQILRERNIGNRAMNRKHVESLAREIVTDRWKVNGDTICLNQRRLVDGQHRLAAVVLAGRSIRSLVVEGVSSDVFDTKDVGKRRSSGDTLSVHGEKNAHRLAASLVLIDRYFTGRAEKSVKYSNTEIEELLEKYPGARDSVQTSNRHRGLITPAVLDACHYLFSLKDPCLADEFVDKVFRGVGLEEGSPWYALRDRLMRNSIAKAKLSKTYIMAICIKAWNHARDGKSVKYLRWADEGEKHETFPVVK